MKTSRVTAHSRGQTKEDCGVWLDTVQLKGKAKRKRSAPPISKLLNPFTNGEGYNVAVALNFTQTKMEMPKTKQSSISNFFTCQRRVLNKMSTSGGPNTGAQETCSLSTFTSFKTTASCAKNVKEDQKCDLLWSDVDYKQGQPNLTEPDAVMWWDKDEASHAPSQNMHSDYKEESSVDLSPPMTKRRTSRTTLSSDSCNVLGHKSSQVPLHYNTDFKSQAFSQKSVSENLCDSELSFLSSLPTENTFYAFGSVINAEDITSTQKPSKEFASQMDKENTTPKSPQKPLSVSHVQSLLKNTKLASPQKHISDETEDEGFNSLFKWTKPNSPSKKKQRWQSLRDNDDESMDMLFTQDSEGFRVIAHRGLQARSPFKDQSNVSLGVPVRSDITFLEEDEDEELFTQDSQGNIVIRH